jgi:hypothetical protein
MLPTDFQIDDEYIPEMAMQSSQERYGSMPRSFPVSLTKITQRQQYLSVKHARARIPAYGSAMSA